jgi:hypothetical protein
MAPARVGALMAEEMPLVGALMAEEMPLAMGEELALVRRLEGFAMGGDGDRNRDRDSDRDCMLLCRG